MADLDKIKLLLGITDDKQDDLINLIQEDTQARLISYINQDGASLKTVPNDLSWVVRELVIQRFNRIGDEGKKSSTESDVTTTWNTDDLVQYDVYFKQYRNKVGGKGIARLI